MSDSRSPIFPCDEASVNKNCFIVAVVANTFEEDTTSEKGHLQRFEINVDAESMPRVEADKVRDDSREDSVQIEEKEERS